VGKVESEQKGATLSALGNSCPLPVVCYSTADHSQIGKFSHTQWWQFSCAVHNGQPYRGSTTTTVLTALNLYSYNTFHLMLLTTTRVYMAAGLLRNLALAHILPVEHQPVGHWSIKCHKVPHPPCAPPPPPPPTHRPHHPLHPPPDSPQLLSHLPPPTHTPERLTRSHQTHRHRHTRNRQ